MTKYANGQSRITFNDKIFNTIEKANKFNYVPFYTLIAFVGRLIKCNSIYGKFECATSPVEGAKVVRTMKLQKLTQGINPLRTVIKRIISHQPGKHLTSLFHAKR